MKPDIIKIAGVVIRDGKLLITKPFDKDVFISLGGTLEDGESELECLLREIEEEIGVKITNTPKFFFRSPIEEAVGKPGMTVQISLYLIEIEGEPIASNEIETIHWISKDEFESKRFKLGSVLERYTIPMLINDKLLY